MWYTEGFAVERMSPSKQLYTQQNTHSNAQKKQAFQYIRHTTRMDTHAPSNAFSNRIPKDCVALHHWYPYNQPCKYWQKLSLVWIGSSVKSQNIPVCHRIEKWRWKHCWGRSPTSNHRILSNCNKELVLFVRICPHFFVVQRQFLRQLHELKPSPF